ncbi:MAG TPA: phosphodiester glycosidase family protein [Chthoniobacterales bacterium]
MLKLSAAFIALFVFADGTRGEWQIVTNEAEASAAAGVEHRHIVIQESGNTGSATIDAALRAPKSGKLQVIDNPSGVETLADAAQRRNCLAGVNGGYFDPNFRPIGLLVSGGGIISPLTRARLLTGVLCASSNGIEILRLREFSRKRKFDEAVECGPFLIDFGKRIQGLDDTRSARRTFAALGRGGNAAFGVSSYLTLAQLSDALSSVRLRDDFKIWRAMNLDGGSSSAFWFARKNGGAFSISEQKSVRDFVGLTPQ